MNKRVAIELAKATGRTAVEYQINNLARGYHVFPDEMLQIDGIIRMMGLVLKITEITRERDITVITLELHK